MTNTTAWLFEAKALGEELERVQAECAAYRSALVDVMGQHDIACPYSYTYPPKSGDCECGVYWHNERIEQTLALNSAGKVLLERLVKAEAVASRAKEVYNNLLGLTESVSSIVLAWKCRTACERLKPALEAYEQAREGKGNDDDK